MEETSEELPNFSIGMDLLSPDPTSNKNKAEKTHKLLVSQICQNPDNFGSSTFKKIFSDTWVHLALIFSISYQTLGWDFGNNGTIFVSFMGIVIVDSFEALLL